MKLPPAIEHQINTYLKEDTVALLSELGKSNAKGGRNIDHARRGREIYTNVRKSIRLILCKNERIYATHIAHSDNKKLLIVAAILDAISPFIIGTSPALIAVLIFKEGLPMVCSDIWETLLSKEQ